MTIDAHQHFWHYKPQRDTWIDDSMSVIKKDFLPGQLEKQLRNCEIDGCVAVQADQSETETEFLLNLAAFHPFIKGVVGWLDLRSEFISDKLTFYTKNKLLKGLRHIVQSEPDEFMKTNEFLRGIQALSSHDLTYDILILPRHLATALDLVRQFPEQSFVIDHIAKPLIKDQVFSPWREDIIEIAKYPNVYCKVSGLITEADWHSWKPEEIYPYLDIVFEAFGTERLMYGSDWPVCNLAGDYNVVYELLLSYLGSFSEMDQKNVLGENAKKFYNLE